MHDFLGLCQYPYCSIIPLVLIFLCKLHSLLLQQHYTCHILFLTLNLTTYLLSPSWILWWDLAIVMTINESFSTPYLKELTPPWRLFPLFLLQSFYFYDHFFIVFVIPMIRTMACYLYSFWFHWFFSFFKFVVKFPDWFLLLFSLIFVFSSICIRLLFLY